jgi:hypothetical protein
MATTPALCFNYEASKFIDSMMTGMVFSSSLMASGRRTDSTIEDIVYPTSISANPEAKKIYKEISESNINFYNSLLAQNVQKDDASKALQYGIYGTGIIAYPIESLVAFKKEVEAQGEWMPEEAKMFIREIEGQLKKYGIDLVYASRDLSARNVLPFPNIFKDPQRINIVRELIKKQDLPKDLNKIISFNAVVTDGLEKVAAEINKNSEKILASHALIKKHWREILAERHELLRDYSTALNIKILSSVSWRVWGDKKRHRTVTMTPDSIYYSIERARFIFKKLTKKIDDRKLTATDIKQIDRVYSVPPTIKNKKDLLYGYLTQAKNSINIYFELIEKYNVKASDAIFLIPRGVRVDVLQDYDLFNLISGYYPVRTCFTVESQLRPLTLIEMAKIKKILEKKGLKNLAKLIVTKCHIPGFCLEEKNCGTICTAVKNYDEKFHEEMKSQLDDEFEERLKNLGK